ncbi:hypothetical protein BGZ49_004936, partial [Haplosporangium sp. Z 27]
CAHADPSKFEYSVDAFVRLREKTYIPETSLADSESVYKLLAILETAKIQRQARNYTPQARLPCLTEPLSSSF